MDKFTRNYTIVLAVVGAIILFSIFYESPGVSKLNAALLENSDVASYPYRFRVVSLEDGLATMGTPRSTEFSAPRALEILYPQLRGLASNSTAIIEAQKELARVQGIARGIVLQSGDVDRVEWKLDENWLLGHGIDPSQL